MTLVACGRTELVDDPEGLLESPIIGGQPAKASEYPWMAAVYFFDLQAPGTGFFQGCGATFVDAKHVVTAAHCSVEVFPLEQGNQERLEPARPESVRVVLRPQRIDQVTEADLLEVSNIYVHPNYDPDVLDFDIAVWELKEPVTLSRFPTLPNNAQVDGWIRSQKNARVIGYGATEASEESNVLMKIDVPLVATSECQTAYSEYGGITDNMICAGKPEGLMDSCFGDSGGPLLLKAGSQNPKLTGIVSWGAGCALPGLPGVYTRISNFEYWVGTCLVGACPSMVAENNPATCAVGYGDCDQQEANGCEKPLITQSTCGACDVSCASGDACVYSPENMVGYCDPAQPIVPSLICVGEGPTGSKQAVFGYHNKNLESVWIDEGVDNHFAHIDSVLESVEEFYPFNVKSRPVVSFRGTDKPVWSLKGPDGITRTAEVTDASPVCLNDSSTAAEAAEPPPAVLRRQRFIRNRMARILTKGRN
ncbi:MAG: S1 family serine peptidase [Myxococcaceae bacterium]